MGEQDLGDILAGGDAGDLPGAAELNADSGAVPLEGEAELNADSGAGRLEGEAELNAATPTQEKTDEKPAEGASTSADNAEDVKAKDASSDDKDEHPVPRKVLLKERQKRQEESRRRQELENQLAEMRGQLEVFSKHVAKAPTSETPKHELTEEEILDQYLDNPPAFIKAQLEAQLSPLQKTLEERTKDFQEALAVAEAKNKFNVSADRMRVEHADFEQVALEFSELIKDDPALMHRFRTNPDPARYAYQYMKTAESVKGVGSLEELEGKISERLEKELRAKIEAEFRKESVDSDAANLTNSSASVQSAGVSPVNYVDQPLGAILEGI